MRFTPAAWVFLISIASVAIACIVWLVSMIQGWC